MTSTDKPSIAELQRRLGIQWRAWPNDATRAIEDAAPVLLEIVAAAKEWEQTIGSPRGDRRADAAEHALLAALAKVRP